MAPFTKPETVLKQAEGLVSVGQTNAALQSLTEMFSSKRFRTTPLTSLEPIMLRFVELCVNMRRGRTAKEGLMQYKNIAQNTSVSSIEVVIKKFIALADAKVQEAQAQADKAVAVDVDDLEASESPEDVLLGAVSGDQNKDRTDRALVTPWLKFSWESYRTALETLKNNARLEAVYQQIALQAFKFCLKHDRKVEFRRLCETLRLHLANVAKYSHQPHSINLSDPDTLQHHLDTRFAQLNASVELELWQEAFRSVEDIHNLLTLAKKAPRPAMMANYYEKLTRIFLTSGNALYHAAAWSRYYSVVRAVGGKTEEELARLAGLVLVSALAVPVTQNDVEEEEAKGKAARLTALLGLSKPPTRSGLLKEALSRNTLKMSGESVRALYQTLEVDLHPLTICSTIAPIFQSLAADSSYAPYLPPLNKVLLARLFSQLSQVYSSVRLAHILELVAPLNEPYTIPATEEGGEPSTIQPEILDNKKIEAFVMGCAKRGELQIRIDHAVGSITFAADVFGASSSSAGSSLDPTDLLQESPAELIRTRFSRLASALSTSLAHLYPAAPAAQTSADQFQALVRAAEDERRRLATRRALTSRRAELLSELRVRKEKEEQSRKAEQARKDKEEESKRMLETIRRREKEKIQKDIEDAKRQEALALAKTLKANGGIKVDIENIADLDTSQLVDLQVKQLDKEKRELSERLRILHKRVDHIERAQRKEERPLLVQDYERQKKEDLEAYEAEKAARIAAAVQQHNDDIATKARLARMMDDYHRRRKEIAGQRETEIQRKREEARVKIEAEKDERRKLFAARRAEEQKHRDEEERTAREKREAEERLEQERAAEAERIVREKEALAAEEEARKAEAAAKSAEMRRQRDLERAKVQEEIAQKAKREEEAEARRAAARKTNGSSTPGTWTRSSGASTPISSTPPQSARPTPPPSGGAYRPPASRTPITASSGGSPFGRRESPVPTPSPTSSGPPRFGAPAGAAPKSSWRDREKATQAASPSPSPAAHTPPAANGNGTPEVGKWQPRRRVAEAPPR